MFQWNCFLIKRVCFAGSVMPWYWGDGDSLQYLYTTVEWRHNGRDIVWHHQLLDCLLNCLSRRISKKTSKLRVTGLCAGTGEFPGSPVNSPHKGPVTRKMFSFDDVIMLRLHIRFENYHHLIPHDSHLFHLVYSGPLLTWFNLNITENKKLHSLMYPLLKFHGAIVEI